MSDRTDMTQDWPADPDNDDLLRFGDQLQAAAPSLPGEALARIEQRMQSAMARPPRRWLRRWSAAAAILISLGVGGYFLTRTPAPAPIVEDRVTVSIGSNSVAVEKPLLRLDDHQSLFTH